MISQKFLLILCFSTVLTGGVLSHADQPISDSPFVHNFDMDGDYTEYLHQVDGMRVWDESVHNLQCRYWGPSESGKEATVTYRYPFDQPIESASIRANLLLHADGDTGALMVSIDGKEYHEVFDEHSHPSTGPPYRTAVYPLEKWVRGSTVVYLKIRLRGKRLNKEIFSAQFMRTAKDLPQFQKPSVYEFKAEW